MAGRNQPRSSSNSATSASKHKIGYYTSWKKDFAWHVPVYDSAGSTVTRLLCSLYQLHRMKQQNGVGTWMEKPCTLLQRDTMLHHKNSKMYEEAEELETTRLALQKDGGIRQAFSVRITVQRKALIGALKLMYWLAKQEVAHTTKFSSLKDLAMQLGCDYLRELNLGRNYQYSRKQIISEYSCLLQEQLWLITTIVNY